MDNKNSYRKFSCLGPKDTTCYFRQEADYSFKWDVVPEIDVISMSQELLSFAYVFLEVKSGILDPDAEWTNGPTLQEKLQDNALDGADWGWCWPAVPEVHIA